jgi:hypothetical protein
MGLMANTTPLNYELEEEPDSLEAQLPRLIAEGKIEEAAAHAIQRQLSRGLAITFLRGTEIIKQYADGREQIIATLPDASVSTPRGAIAIETK